MRAPSAPRRRTCLIAAGATLVLALGGAQGTRSAFTDSKTFTWDVSSGSVALQHDGDGLTFDAAPLAPGDRATAVVRLANAGTLPVSVALTRAQLASTAPGGCHVRDALAVRIVEDRDGDPATTGDRSEVVDAPLPDAAATLPVGRFAPGEARSYEVAVVFAPQGGATATDNDNCFQGSVATERFGWQAVEDRS